MVPSFLLNTRDMISFEKFFFLEYRHNLADGTSAPSIHAHNGKNPNNINKKNLHTVGPYKPKNQTVHNVGTVLIGASLMNILTQYNLAFQDGQLAKIKNSPMAGE